YIVVILAQSVVEEFFPNYALISAVFAMTLLQGILLFNIVMSTVGIFYIIVDFMDDEGFLPEIPKWFTPQTSNVHLSALKNTGLTLFAVFFGIGVCLYNMDYLTSAVQTKPVTVSHRG
ncbi:glycerophosphoryl diester phosphodiesterase membrane domain-containing protein, partial [Salmonella enterica]